MELVFIEGRRYPTRLIPGGERIPSGGEKSFHGRPRIFTAGNGKIGEEGYWVGRERDFLSLSMID